MKSHSEHDLWPINGKVQHQFHRYSGYSSVMDGQKDGRMDGDGQHENSIPLTNKVCGEYNYLPTQIFLIGPEL